MSDALKLLVVEDETSDFLLLDRYLRQHGVSAVCRRVCSDKDLEDALGSEWDLLLSDYNVPGMDLRATLDAVKARRPDLPVILISGSVGEETAVELLRLGIDDFILKDNLTRLVPSLRRTLEDRDERKARREAERALQEAQTAIFTEQRNARVAALSLMEDALAAQKRAEGAQAALLESEAKYRLLAEHAADCIFWLGPDGAYRYMSPACERLTGHAPEEFLADPALMLRVVHPDDRDTYERHVTDPHEADEGDLEFRVVHADGSLRSVLHECRPIFAEDGAFLGRHGTHRDVTERRRAEEERGFIESQLQQAQKMESIGRLAGGVAHDFNNLLGVILGYAELLQMGGDLTERQEEGLTAIRDAGERAQELTQQLLMFSRKQIIQPKPVDWNRQIESSLKIYRRILGEDMEVDFRPGPEVPPILADPQQLDQLLANLLVNARDAIHARTDPGREARIDVATDLVAQGIPGPAGRAAEPGPHARLTVRDTGIGMDAATRERIFEPFFTTKAEGKGTGLGLATVFGVVGQNNGTLRVESEPGSGSTFEVYWPVLARAEQAPAARARVQPELLEGSEVVFLVEDFDQLRKACAAGLTRLGYTVVEAASAEHVRKLLADGVPEPDLLVTDVVLPGTNGRLLADELCARWPGLPVLFISGYTADVIAERGLLEDGVEFLHKPFSNLDLAQKVREVLARR